MHFCVWLCSPFYTISWIFSLPLHEDLKEDDRNKAEEGEIRMLLFFSANHHTDDCQFSLRGEKKGDLLKTMFSNENCYFIVCSWSLNTHLVLYWGTMSLWIWDFLLWCSNRIHWMQRSVQVHSVVHLNVADGFISGRGSIDSCAILDYLPMF